MKQLITIFLACKKLQNVHCKLYVEAQKKKGIQSGNTHVTFIIINKYAYKKSPNHCLLHSLLFWCLGFYHIKYHVPYNKNTTQMVLANLGVARSSTIQPSIIIVSSWIIKIIIFPQLIFVSSNLFAITNTI